MPLPSDQLLRFKRNHFSTRLPRAYLYSRSHQWLREEESGLWTVGLTGFATRMLGEIVELELEAKTGNDVRVGEVIGWIEGFKAVSDLFAVVSGSFAGANDEALGDPECICADSYDGGWIYRVRGVPDSDALAIDGYVEHLNGTIDKMLEKPWRGAPEGEGAGS